MSWCLSKLLELSANMNHEDVNSGDPLRTIVKSVCCSVFRLPSSLLLAMDRPLWLLTVAARLINAVRLGEKIPRPKSLSRIGHGGEYYEASI